MKRIGIIGYGNMGKAFSSRMKINFPISVFEKDKEKCVPDRGITFYPDLCTMVRSSDVIIIAVKPQDFAELFATVKTCLEMRHIVISVAAGITTSFIESYLGQARVIRAMPNIAVLVGKSMTTLCKGKFASNVDLSFAQELFMMVGMALTIEERMMDAATAIAGSGPAYICYLMESRNMLPSRLPALQRQQFLSSFILAATEIGFTAKQAKELVNETYDGTLELLEKLHIAPADLRNRVTSKGGTTEAALNVLMKEGSLVDAVKAALKRGQELAGG